MNINEKHTYSRPAGASLPLMREICNVTPSSTRLSHVASFNHQSGAHTSRDPHSLTKPEGQDAAVVAFNTSFRRKKKPPGLIAEGPLPGTSSVPLQAQ